MPLTRRELMDHLQKLHIVTKTVEHAAVFTVDESEQFASTLPGGHTKNLFLKDAKDRLWLVVAESRSVVDLKALPKLIGAARLSFGKPDLLMEVLGVTPGSVTAFSVVNDHATRVAVVMDAALMRHDIVNCHPLVNTATTSIALDDLMRFLSTTGHAPTIVDLAATPPAASSREVC